MTSLAVRERLAALRHVGDLTERDAAAEGCRLIEAVHGADGTPEHIRLMLLLDEAGVVRRARFRSNAEGDLLAAYDVMCELLEGQLLAEAAQTISPRAAEARLRGDGATPAFPVAIDGDRPFVIVGKALQSYERLRGGKTRRLDELPWSEIGLFEKVRRIEAVLDAEVRPALASDGGGIELVDLVGDQLVVQYHGACGSCSSSIGGTLRFIEDTLNNRLGTELRLVVSRVDSELPSFVP
ncbi:MAG: NifU family protein [Planctomycetota bacterium]|nr:NifU family protein [Planctomycetota bacterium]MDW8372587.1 NifU family protein [Planctomycetota bacterium]